MSNWIRKKEIVEHLIRYSFENENALMYFNKFEFKPGSIIASIDFVSRPYDGEVEKMMIKKRENCYRFGNGIVVDLPLTDKRKMLETINKFADCLKQLIIPISSKHLEEIYELYDLSEEVKQSRESTWLEISRMVNKEIIPEKRKEDDINRIIYKRFMTIMKTTSRQLNIIKQYAKIDNPDVHLVSAQLIEEVLQDYSNEGIRPPGELYSTCLAVQYCYFFSGKDRENADRVFSLLKERGMFHLPVELFEEITKFIIHVSNRNL